MSVNVNSIRAMARFSSKFRNYFTAEIERLGLSSWDDLRKDWWAGLNFFFNRSFFQGRRDELSEAFRGATIKALESFLPSELSLTEKASRLITLSDKGWFNKDKWNEMTNPVKQALEQKYEVEVNEQQKKSSTGRRLDREMVLDTLRFICCHSKAKGTVLNIAAHTTERIESSDIRGIYRELDELRQVGPKITSLFLRDLVTIMRLQKHLNKTDYELLQPVDTWVKKIATKLNIQSDNLSVALVDACRQAKVDPIQFNEGAWYLGSHSFDLLLENLERIKA